MHRGYLISIGLVIALIVGLAGAFLMPHDPVTNRVVDDGAPAVAIVACMFAAWAAWRRPHSR